MSTAWACWPSPGAAQSASQQRISVLEAERDHLSEPLETARAARAEAWERATGAVERAAAETDGAGRAEHAAIRARHQLDTARSQLDELRDQVGELRAADATASAERDPWCRYRSGNL